MTVTGPSVLLSDRPVGDSGDQLWKAQEGRKAKAIRAQLEQIASTFAAPLTPGGTPPASLTVAIMGRWGAGKSSALRVLRDLACAKARALAPAGDAAAAEALAARLVFCDYVAPVWQQARLDPRTTLVARMLVSLAGSDADAVKDLLVPASAISQQLASTSEPGSAEGQRMWTSITLEQIAAAVSRLRDFDELLRARLRGKGGEPRVVVVMVDDLDRCAPSFVYSLLNELQQLGGLDSFFFVVAADHETLRRAVRAGSPEGERNEIEADHELDKLVQHAVHVPALDVAGTAALVEHLLHGSDDPASKALRSNVALLFAGLPEPTPRAVKRCLNFLASRLADLSSDSDGRCEIKRLLLEHTWEDFYRRYFLPMTSHGPAWNIEPIALLEQAVCRAETVDGSDRRLSHELAFVGDVFPSLPWRDLPLSLVRFLGTEPSLVAPPAQKAPDLPPLPPLSPPGASSSTLESTLGSALSSPPWSEKGTLPGSESFSAAQGEPPGRDDFLEVFKPTADSVLRDTQVKVAAIADHRARLEHALHAIFDLAPFQPESDQLALNLGRALLPELCKDPRDGKLLSAVLDRHVALLRRYGLRRTACAVLDCAYRAADYVSYVRDAYSLYLLGAGAVEASRRVSANQKVEYREVLSDDPRAQPMLVNDDPRTRSLIDLVLPPAR